MSINPRLVTSLFLCFSLVSCGGGGGSEDAPTSPPVVVVQDSDGDGVNDDLDTCANTPAGDTVDANGCSLPVDSDNDGVNDDLDQCANTPAGDTVDASGCSLPVDGDNDGVNDDLDQCANTPTGDTVDASGCSLPVDGDNDGVNDDLDQCASTPTGDAVDANGCSLPVDSDNDGVNDGLDQCANTPINTTVDNVGCPIVAIGSENEITIANSKLVGGLASSKTGFTVYVFDSDLAFAGESVCNDGCAANWPPLLVTDGIASGANELATIVRQDGSIQATYKGRPLYFYEGDTNAGQTTGDNVSGWHSVDYSGIAAVKALYDTTTQLEPVASYVRDDGVVVTRLGDRGRDRHAKDITFQDHYDHYLAHYWQYRTARVQLEDHVPNGQSLIRATFITEAKLGAREFRVWFWGRTTTGQFHFNPQKEEEKVSQNESGVVYVGKGTWNNDFEKTSEEGEQYMYTLDIVNKWENGGQFQPNLSVGTNMEFEISQFLLAPPAGARLNYYGTSFVYVIGQPGAAPFEWERDVDNTGGSNDGTPIPAKGLLGGDTTLGYNYSEEPAGRFMQMATNLSPGNAQVFVEGRRIHHTNFEDGTHDERFDNPVWTEQIGKAGNHYINHSCAACHVRNGKALVDDVGGNLEKWVFKVGDVNGNPDPLIGSVLQPAQTGAGAFEGSVTLGAWSELENGLRSPNYVFSNGTPATFSARIAPHLVGLGLLDAVDESTILAWADENDTDNNGISGRAAVVPDALTGKSRLGRFGYKAGAYSVQHQAALALNTDIGVMTSLVPAPDCGSQQTSCGDTGAEITDVELGKLTKYVSLLGVGARRDYANDSGEIVFAKAGCGDCHRATMITGEYHPLAELRNQTIHPYTDMLLHDMGPGLADNLGEGTATGAEWRTTALWGLGHAQNVMLGDAKGNDSISLARETDDIDRIGYLHDGRARTIEEAILWHGGEGQSSKLAFEALSETDKAALLDFLTSI
jgi:CxxC motif-containing protein (DUF1111 family)/predicted lipoprotein with Yx(FWY)xxD motif